MTFKHKLVDRVSEYKFNNGRGGEEDNKFYTCDEVADEIINLIDAELTNLVVEERANRRGICTRTIRKIREQILYLQKDNSEKTSPEPPN